MPKRLKFARSDAHSVLASWCSSVDSLFSFWFFLVSRPKSESSFEDDGTLRVYEPWRVDAWTLEGLVAVSFVNEGFRTRGEREPGTRG